MSWPLESYSGVTMQTFLPEFTANGRSCKPPCEERADDLAAVHTDDRVDLLLIDVVLHKDTGRISRHAVLMLHAGDIKVVAVVGVAGRKMVRETRRSPDLDFLWI